MKAHVIATLIVRGNALAVLIVALIRSFDLLYVLCDPMYAPRLAAPGAMRYTLTYLGFEVLLSILLFVSSRRVGWLFAGDLDKSIF